jgi:type II secretion system protein C
LLYSFHYRVPRYQIKIDLPASVFHYEKRASDIPGAQIYGHRNIFTTEAARSDFKDKGVAELGDVPRLVMPEPMQLPERKEPELVDPLQIVLSGIILSSQEDTSICIISDETDKESTFSVGDKIKDGVLIRILRDKIVVLRANGQQETFFLHEADADLYESSAVEDFIIKKDTNEYEIHLDKFLARFGSLGEFLSELFILSIAEEDDRLSEIKVINSLDFSLATVLGLQEGDLLKTINGFDLRDYRDRVDAYDSVSSIQAGDQVIVQINRSGENLKLTYNLIVPGSGLFPATGRVVFRGDIDSPAKATTTVGEDKGGGVLFSEKASSDSSRLSSGAKSFNRQQDKEYVEEIRNNLKAKMRSRVG